MGTVVLWIRDGCHTRAMAGFQKSRRQWSAVSIALPDDLHDLGRLRSALFAAMTAFLKGGNSCERPSSARTGGLSHEGGSRSFPTVDSCDGPLDVSGRSLS